MGKTDGNVFILGGSIADLKRHLDTAKTVKENNKNKNKNGMEMLAEKVTFLMCCNMIKEVHTKCVEEVEKGIKNAEEKRDYSGEAFEEIMKKNTQYLQDLIDIIK